VSDSQPQGESPRSSFVQRDADFESLYANNVHIETSVWDLKLLFGELDQRGDGDGNGAVIRQHTAMTIPWMQAKILAYFLSVNIMIAEHQRGRINIPAGVMPPAPDSIPPSTPPAPQDLLDRLTELHRRLFGE
jgi:hypothetical protein